MEMEGRGFSDLLRNTSEEIFLKTMMENPIGITAPSMEMLGFKNISQSFRGDSEELFNNWLTTGEAIHFCFFGSYFHFHFLLVIQKNLVFSFHFFCAMKWVRSEFLIWFSEYYLHKLQSCYSDLLKGFVDLEIGRASVMNYLVNYAYVLFGVLF